MEDSLYLVAADDDGEVDDDCPALDGSRHVHLYGILNFVLKRRRAREFRKINRHAVVIKGTSDDDDDGDDNDNDDDRASHIDNSTDKDNADGNRTRRPNDKSSLHIGPHGDGDSKHSKADPLAQFLQASELGSIDVVYKLIDQEVVDINAPGIDDWTSLHFASRQGHLSVVNCLLKEDAHINAVTTSGWTPLHLACYQNHIEVAEILLTCGAELEATDENKHTPLDLAKLRAIKEAKAQEDRLQQQKDKQEKKSQKEKQVKKKELPWMKRMVSKKTKKKEEKKELDIDQILKDDEMVQLLLDYAEEEKDE